MTFNHAGDPAVRWSAQLQGLYGRRRETVIRALRHSIDGGYPADGEGVRILISYAQGQISARQYVAQILETLGFVPPAHTPAPVRRAPEPWREPVALRPDPSAEALSAPMPASPRTSFRDSWHESPPAGVREPDRYESTTITQSRRTSRQEAVRAFVTGQIPMEEFLRLSRIQAT